MFFTTKGSLKRRRGKKMEGFIQNWDTFMFFAIVFFLININKIVNPKLVNLKTLIWPFAANIVFILNAVFHHTGDTIATACVFSFSTFSIMFFRFEKYDF